MPRATNHISICICTFRRPKLLKRLLNRIEDQRTDGIFSISIVVVDNDAQESGYDAVNEARQQSKLLINYYVEPERNISLARNRSVESAQGDFIAFIDDDEFPEEDWLLNAYRTLQSSGATGVLGPVKPHFDLPPPKWLIQSRILERPTFSTGWTLTNARDTRTGNVLFCGSLFSDRGNRFDPIYGRTGGGDAVFFKQMMEKGYVFVWCNEAVVNEAVPLERQRKSYYIKRAFTRGMSEALESPVISLSTLRSAMIIPVYALVLPFAWLLGQHHFMRFLIKECDHFAKLLAYLGIRPVRERPY